MTERQSARMSKIKNGGLHQFGVEPFEQQRFVTAGIEGVNGGTADGTTASLLHILVRTSFAEALVTAWHQSDAGTHLAVDD